MSVSYSLDRGLLHITAHGEYEPADIPRAFSAGLADRLCPNPVAVLLDVQGSTALARRSPEQIRLIAEYLAPYAERIGRRCAVVVANPVQQSLGRMGAAWCEGVGVEARVFLRHEAARAWLVGGEAPEIRNES